MEKPIRIIVEYSRKEVEYLLSHGVENLRLTPTEIEAILCTPEVEVSKEARESLYMPTKTLLKLAVRKRVEELRGKSL